MTTSPHVRVSVTYQPILDVARGVAAGYRAEASTPPRAGDHPAEAHPGAPLPPPSADPAAAAALVTQALDTSPTLPPNTFLSIPLHARVATSAPVAAALDARDDLRGVVLEVVGFETGEPSGPLESALRGYRSRGAALSIGGHGAAQPELTAIVRLKPSIIRLGRDWTRGIDRSEAKRSAIEVTGRLAAQLDAWVLAEGVSTSAELRALAGLNVPLAEGPFIGSPRTCWPEIELTARTALPKVSTSSGGALRGLLQRAYTATNALAAAAVLPETTGFDTVVVIDAHRRPTLLFEQDGDGPWRSSEVLAVNIDTSLPDAVARAMARPRPVRFTPLVGTDIAGRFLGILRIERLMSHLAEPST